MVTLTQLQRTPYDVLFAADGFALSSLHVSRGRSHAIWDAGPWQIKLNELLENTRFKSYLTPISPFETKTLEPTLGFIARFDGQISGEQLVDLTAEILAGTNLYDLTSGNSTMDKSKGSFVKSWTLGLVPATNNPVELRVRFGSGTELARISIPSSRDEFNLPLISGEAATRKYVESLLGDLLGARRNSIETLRLLHQVAEESGSPPFLSPFEFLFYENESLQHAVPSSDTEFQNVSDRLRLEARTFLQSTQYNTHLQEHGRSNW